MNTQLFVDVHIVMLYLLKKSFLPTLSFAGMEAGQQTICCYVNEYDEWCTIRSSTKMIILLPI